MLRKWNANRNKSLDILSDILTTKIPYYFSILRPIKWFDCIYTYNLNIIDQYWNWVVLQSSGYIILIATVIGLVNSKNNIIS